MIEVKVSKDAVKASLQQHVSNESLGMLEADIIEIRGVTASGDIVDIEQVVLGVQARQKPLPAPVERKTATGFGLRLATHEGRNL